MGVCAAVSFPQSSVRLQAFSLLRTSLPCALGALTASRVAVRLPLALTASLLPGHRVFSPTLFRSKLQATQQDPPKAASMAVWRVTTWLNGRRARVAAACWGRRSCSARLGSRFCAAAPHFVVVLLLLLLLTPHSAASQAAPRQVSAKVLMLKLTNLPMPQKFLDAVELGLMGALWSRNFTAADGVNIEVISKATTTQGSGAAVEEAVKTAKDLLLLAGVIGDTTFLHTLPAVMRNSLVSFAPFTGSSVVREWNPNVYFVRADPAAELLALLRYAVAELRVLRLGFMYLQGVSFGDREYEQAQHVMSRMGYALSGVFTVKSSVLGGADDKEFDDAWERFVATRPQAVIVFGSPYQDTKKFMKRMLKDERTAGAYLLAPSAVQDAVLGAWRAAVDNGGLKFVPGQVIATATNPLAKDTRYNAIRRFQEVMKKYLANRTDIKSGAGQGFPDENNAGELMVAAWIAGEVLAQALGNREWVKDRNSFKASLFKQRRYLIDDLVIGDYGGDCSAVAVSQGATCRCNQGGHTVYIKRFVEGYRAELRADDTFTAGQRRCGAAGTLLYAPLDGVLAVMQDNEYAQLAVSSVLGGAKAAIASQGHDAPGMVTLHVLNTSIAGARNALEEEHNERLVHFVGGVVTEAMLDVESVAFLDPLQLEPRLNRFRRHVIHLSPTLEQQFFVLAKYLRDAGIRAAHAVIRGEEAAAVAEVLRRSLVTFGGSLRSATLLAGSDVLAGHLPKAGDVFVAGLAAGDVAAVARHMALHDGVRVFVAFSEFALLHADFVAAFGGGAGADRVVFATSLPHWGDANPTSETAREFLAAVPNPTQRTPLALMGFAATRLLGAVLSRMGKVGAKQLTDFFYTNVAVTANDMQYGPFVNGTACTAAAAGGAGCGKNYGATRISVWSLAHALDPAVPVLHPAVTST
ncbi:esag4, partial [Trypanosoma conorhini]